MSNSLQSPPPRDTHEGEVSALTVDFCDSDEHSSVAEIQMVDGVDIMLLIVPVADTVI